MERLCVSIYEPSESGRNLLHDVLSAYAISQNVEIIIKWLKPSVRDDELAAAAAEMQLALINAEDAAPAAVLGQLLYRENPACAVIFYGEPAPQKRAELVEHFIELFPARPVSYLTQPSRKDFYRSVAATAEMLADRRAFIWETRGVKYRVPCEMILYFRSDRNYVYVKLKGGTEYAFLGKLTDVVKRLPAGFFVRVHQSYLVKRSEITFIDKGNKSVHLSSGEDIFISKAHYKETLEI